MLEGLALILVCQLAGEAIVTLAGLPLPGPVLGLILMLILLAVWPGALNVVGQTADGLLAHLSLLFVPAAVGIIQHLDALSDYGIALIASLLISTVLTLIATAAAFLWLQNLTSRGDEDPSSQTANKQEG